MPIATALVSCKQKYTVAPCYAPLVLLNFFQTLNFRVTVVREGHYAVAIPAMQLTMNNLRPTILEIAIHPTCHHDSLSYVPWNLLLHDGFHKISSGFVTTESSAPNYSGENNAPNISCFIVLCSFECAALRWWFPWSTVYSYHQEQSLNNSWVTLCPAALLLDCLLWLIEH